MINYIKNNILINIFNLLILVIFLVPFSYSTFEFKGKANRSAIYIFEELDLLVFYIPLFILTVSFQIMKKSNIIMLLNTLLCILYSLIALNNLRLSSEGISYGIGNFLILFLGPLMIIIFKFSQKKRNDVY